MADLITSETLEVTLYFQIFLFPSILIWIYLSKVMFNHVRCALCVIFHQSVRYTTSLYVLLGRKVAPAALSYRVANMTYAAVWYIVEISGYMS